MSTERIETKLLIVDEQMTSLDPLIQSLSCQGLDIYVADDGRRAIDMAATLSPEIVLMDTEPDTATSVALCHELRSHPGMKPASILLLVERGCGETAEELVVDLIEKPICLRLVTARIRSLAEVHQMLNELRAREARLQEEVERWRRPELDVRPMAVEGVPSVMELQRQLSEREYQVLQHLLAGLTSLEIAQLLQLSDATVRTYRSRIMQKLSAPNFVALVKIGIKYGVTPPP